MRRQRAWIEFDRLLKFLERCLVCFSLQVLRTQVVMRFHEARIEFGSLGEMPDGDG